MNLPVEIEKFDKHLDGFLESIDRIRGNANKIGKKIGSCKREAVVLLSRKDDLMRQIDEGKHLVREQRSPSSYCEVLKSQPLDEESVQYKKKLFIKAYCVQKSLGRLQTSVRLLEGIYEFRSVSGETPASLSKSLDQLRLSSFMSPTKKMLNEKKARESKRLLFDAIKTGYKTSKEMVENVIVTLRDRTNEITTAIDQKNDGKAYKGDTQVIEKRKASPAIRQPLFSPIKASRGFSDLKVRHISRLDSQSSLISKEEKTNRSKIDYITIQSAIRELSQKPDDVPSFSLRSKVIIIDNKEKLIDRRLRLKTKQQSNLMTVADKSLDSNRHESVKFGLSSTSASTFSARLPQDTTSSELEKLSGTRFTDFSPRQPISFSTVADKALGT